MPKTAPMATIAGHLPRSLSGPPDTPVTSTTIAARTIRTMPVIAENNSRRPITLNVNEIIFIATLLARTSDSAV